MLKAIEQLAALVRAKGLRLRQSYLRVAKRAAVMGVYGLSERCSLARGTRSRRRPEPLRLCFLTASVHSRSRILESAESRDRSSSRLSISARSSTASA